MAVAPRPLAELILPKIDTSGGPDACHPWRYRGAPLPQFNQQRQVDGVRRSTRINVRHWLVVHVTGQPVPTGSVIVMRCGDKHTCCNLRHFEIITRSEKIQRHVVIDRCRSGRHDLTDERNVRRGPDGGRDGCLPCLREKQAALHERERGTRSRAGRYRAA